MAKGYKKTKPQYYKPTKASVKKWYFLLLLLIPIIIVGVWLIIRGNVQYQIITQSPSEGAYMVVPPTPAILSDEQGYLQEAFVTKPTAFSYSDPINFGFKTYILDAGEQVDTYDRPDIVRFSTKEAYTDLVGITTYRGSHYRSSGTYGSARIENKEMRILWTKSLPEFELSGPQEGTAQPLIIQWPADIMQTMSFKTAKKNKVQLTEVIFADKSGYVYFIDLDDGEISRTPMPTIAYTEGTPTLDPRGYPLLFIGQSVQQDGIVEKSRYNYFYVYDLIREKRIFRFGSSAVEPFSDNKWQGYTGSPLVYDDRVIIAAESGILYSFKLDAEYDMEDKSIVINEQAELVKYKYENNVTEYQADFDREDEKPEPRNIKSGTTGSLAAYKDYVFFSDESGYLQCIDINHMMLIYAVNLKGNGEYTLNIEDDGFDSDRFNIFSGTRLELVGNTDEHSVYFRKIEGLSGKILWEKTYQVWGAQNYRAGLAETALLGENNLAKYVYYAVVNEESSNTTNIYCVNKSDGQVVWKNEIFSASKSAPTAIYGKDGKGYVIFCDLNRHAYLIDGLTGEVVSQIILEAGADGVPVVFNNKMIVHLNNDTLVCVRIE